LREVADEQAAPARHSDECGCIGRAIPWRSANSIAST
jgi:hypothetical protein